MNGAEYNIKKMVTSFVIGQTELNHFLEDSFDFNKNVALSIQQNELNNLRVLIIFQRDHVRFRNNHHNNKIQYFHTPSNHGGNLLFRVRNSTLHNPFPSVYPFILYNGNSNRGPNHLVFVERDGG